MDNKLLSEKLAKILEDFAYDQDGEFGKCDKTAEGEAQAILSLFRSVVPDEAQKEDGLCECDYLQCLHGGFNACREKILKRLE